MKNLFSRTFQRIVFLIRQRSVEFVIRREYVLDGTTGLRLAQGNGINEDGLVWKR